MSGTALAEDVPGAHLVLPVLRAISGHDHVWKQHRLARPIMRSMA